MVSCNKAEHDTDRKVVTEWLEKTIIIPENLTPQILDNPLNFNLDEFTFKIVCYVDSDGCVPCRMRLQSWNELIDKYKLIAGEEVGFIMIINSKDRRYINRLLKKEKFLHPVIIDEDNLFDKANNLPNSDTYHTFLLDSENKIAAIGNPTANPKVANLYENLILSEFEQLDEDRLNLNNSKAHSFGAIQAGDTLAYTFDFANTDSITYHVQGIYTSCDCIKCDFLYDSIYAGEHKELVVHYTTGQNVGVFTQYVDVFFHEIDRPYRFLIYGILIK
jgi:hypothetical protein